MELGIILLGGGHINIQQQTYQFVLSQDSPEYSQLENTENVIT